MEALAISLSSGYIFIILCDLGGKKIKYIDFSDVCQS